MNPREKLHAMLTALKAHWPEYLMEAAELALFMISAGVFTILLFHPESILVQVMPAEFPRRMLIGIAMGLTLLAIVYSPWGKRSGAHMNPAFTLTFYTMGKIAPPDALFYMMAQFAGGIAGIGLVALCCPHLLSHSTVNYAVTVPGPGGVGAAFAGETVIAFILITVVLISNSTKLARFTGLFAGICVALFITFESTYSGMSMNPARTIGSAALARLWTGLWVYFVAPPLGMLGASMLFRLLQRGVPCAKFHHENNERCIFCEYQQAQKQTTRSSKGEEAVGRITLIAKP